MLVRIDHDGVGVADGRESAADRLHKRVGNEREIAAVGCIHVDPEAITLPKRQDLVQRIHGADGRGAQRGHYRTNIAFAQFGFEGFHTHAPAVVATSRSSVRREGGGDLAWAQRASRPSDSYIRRLDTKAFRT